MDIYIIIGSLLFSALFSGMETAYVSANKLRLELAGKNGTINGRVLSRLHEYPSYFIGTLLIGNIIALVIYGIFMARLLEAPITSLLPSGWELGFVVMLLQTILATLLVLMAGEFIPKILFKINANGILSIFAIPVGLIFLLLLPFIALVIFLSKLIIRLVFRISVEESKPVFSKLDLQSFVQDQSGSEEEDHEVDPELFENALYLIQVKVKECMVPRPEIVATDLHAPITDLKEKFIEGNLSRIIIFDGSIDTIVGYVHHHDLLTHPPDIQSILFTIPVIPETMPATDALNLFTQKRKTIAWVVDEYGGTAGIVTLEDILEEIFGEIEDEHDQEAFVERQISDNEYIFSARLEIDYLNDQYDLQLPKGEYETLGGLIVAHHYSIPYNKEIIRIGDYEFYILYATETKIETVKLKVLPVGE